MRIVIRMVFMAMAWLGAVAVASPGLCGFIQTETDGSQTLVSQGRIKSVSNNPSEKQIIFDLKKGTLIVLDQQERVAASGTVEEYCGAVRKMTDMMAQRMERMKQQMEAQGMTDSSIPAHRGQGSVQEVRVERMGPGESIAGYATEKYQVYADGELYEEAWIATDSDLLREIGNREALVRFQACASQMMGGNTVEATQDYKELMTSGWLLKSIEYEEGYSDVMVDVSRIEARSIPDSEFEIPSGYETVPLNRLFGMR